jgi:hypothetical protein
LCKSCCTDADRKNSDGCPTPPATKKGQLLDGCARQGSDWSKAWGKPRLEDKTSKAGAIVCCNGKGKALRVIGGVCNSGKANAHAPVSQKRTYKQAQDHCLKAGYDLCETQAQLDTGCGTGCAYDAVVVWIKS